MEWKLLICAINKNKKKYDFYDHSFALNLPTYLFVKWFYMIIITIVRICVFLHIVTEYNTVLCK